MLTDSNIVIGYSGHAYVVIDAAIESDLKVSYYSDKKEAIKNPFQLKYLGYEKDKDFEGWDKNYGFILGIGNNKIREEIANLLIKEDEKLLTIIHPKATVSSFSLVESGTFIAANAVVNMYAQIGNYVILNTGSVVEHECTIKDGAHIAPGAVLAGNVKVGRRSFIGANSVIREGITVGDDVIVGAGSTIIRNIPNGQKIVGNPGREI